MLNGKNSEWKEVTSGVPQGSVLGPVLFIVYINDMPDKLRKFCKLFADDAKIFTEIESPNDQDELQADLFDSCEWGKDWLLEHNIKKCKFIQYGNIIYDYEYKMTNRNNEVITITKDSEEKDLGIWFEENLKFNKHISVTVKKANRLVGMIKRTFSFMNKELFLIIYKSLIRSVLDYGSPVWNPSTKKYRQMLENVQRRATKLIPELKNLSYQERLKELNLPTLYYRRKRYDLIQLFKIIAHIEDTEVEKFGLEFNDNNTRGHIFKLQKPRCNKSFRQQIFPIRCIDDWNVLQDKVVESETVLGFKTQLDKAWKGKRFELEQIY